MKFRDFLSLNEVRYKGFYRQFRNQNPNMPNYVAKDLYNNRVGYSMKKAVSNNTIRPAMNAGQQPLDPNAPTIGWTDNSQTPLNGSTPSKIIQASQLNDIQWSPKPVTINVSPMDFDDSTQEIMIYRRFGFAPDQGVRDDANRIQIQKQMIQQKNLGKNEPIVVLWENGKYKLLEGWHRTMNYLVFDHNEQIGAPPEQIEILRTGNINDLDLSQWRPVPIQAYVGIKNDH